MVLTESIRVNTDKDGEGRFYKLQIWFLRDD